jgi:DNA-binding phage protein
VQSTSESDTREMYDSKKHTMDTIAKTLHVSRASLYRALEAKG